MYNQTKALKQIPLTIIRRNYSSALSSSTPNQKWNNIGQQQQYSLLHPNRLTKSIIMKTTKSSLSAITAATIVTMSNGFMLGNSNTYTGTTTSSSRKSFTTTPSFINPSSIMFHTNSPFIRNSFQKNHKGHLTQQLYMISSSTTDQEEETQDLKEEDNNFATSYHAPVMWKECIDALLRRSHNKQKKRKKQRKRNMKQQQEKENVDETLIQSQQQEEQQEPRIFIDGTLGGGGHSHYLLQNLSPNDIVIGCDVDPSALTTASKRLEHYIPNPDTDDDNEWDKPIFIPVQSNFKDMASVVQELKHPLTNKLFLKTNTGNDDIGNDDDDGALSFVGVDGILLDLGVSSHQINNADRGFAFMKDGPLDMRMSNGAWNDFNHDDTGNDEDVDVTSAVVQNGRSKTGFTAADICNEFSQDELIRIFKAYGDEPRARKISQAIIESRPLATTADLKDAVALVVPEFAKKGRRMGRTATLARVFQSLRIVVNEEDLVLEEALEEMAPTVVKKGGRMVVLSYHSMEDRAVKRVMRDGSIQRPRVQVERDLYGNEIYDDGSGNGPSKKPWKTLGKKQKASDEEIEINSRARSAMLRVAERQ